jgi:mono/diheme cytochrome c family protein
MLHTYRSIRHRATVSAAVLAVALALAACGSSSPTSGSPGSGSAAGSSAASATTAAGRQVFASAGCASCHTLAAAGASGTVGPNLDTLKPSYSAVVAQVTHGGGGMPSFGRTLSKAQIDSVAKFVSTASH